MSRWIYQIPLALTLSRAVLGPVVLGLAFFAPNKILFALCLLAAFLSDVFDGIIARHLKIATANLRRLDSIADSIFYVCASISAYWLYPNAVKARCVPLIILLGLELLRYCIDYFKYGKEASYHMWSSKLWGIFLFVGFLALLGFGNDGIWLSLAVYVGIFADCEGLLISLLLNDWHHDVPTVLHALKIKKNQI